MGLRDSYKDKGVTLAPAGQWKRDEDGKKMPIVAFRKDGLDFANYPNDNFAKFRIEEAIAPDGMRLVIIDTDSAEATEKAPKLFPELADTFTSTTSQPHKKHYFAYAPLDKIDELRSVNAFEQIDILSYGIAFEAHFFNEETYRMPDFSKEIVALSDKSLEIIGEAVKSDTTSYGRGTHTAFVNKEMARLVDLYINDKTEIKGDAPETNAQRNELMKHLTLKTDKQKGQRKFPLPEPSHTALNNIALLLAKNSRIPTEQVIKFLEKFVVKVWGFSLQSKETQVHLYNSIIPTLPHFEKLYSPMEDYREFEEKVLENSATNANDKNFKWVLFQTSKNGATKFVQINRDSYKLREMNRNTMFDLSYIRTHYTQLSNEDLEDIPHLALMSNPYEDLVMYDEVNDYHVLNICRPSAYKLDSITRDDKPNNVLTDMIEKFFDNEKHEELYYHWLAHIMFGDKPVNMVMWLCSDVNAVAGTGKTILASALPSQLIGFEQSTTVDSSVADAGWAQIFEGVKLLSYNDLNRMTEKDWLKLYAKIKDEATNSTSKIRNSKGGDVYKSTVGICQSGSSNFIPKVDGEDRRFFIVSPKKKLDSRGGFELQRIFEAERGDHHIELQELADYLRHLYETEKNKFRFELFTEAPKTAEKVASAQQGAYTHTIIPRIHHNPRELFDIFKEETEYSSEWQDWQIVEFIKMQTTDGKAYLPHQFLNYLINRVKGEDTNRSVASVMSTLERQKKDKIGSTHQKFKDADTVKKLGLPNFISGYATWGCVIDIDEPAYKNFKPKRIEPKGVQTL